MNLVRATAAGRPVAVGPRLLLISPPSFRGLGTLLAFLRSRIAAPEGARDNWLPPLLGDAAEAEYRTPLGAALLLHVATRRDHPGLSLEECLALSAEFDAPAIDALVAAVFVRGAPNRHRQAGVGKPAPGRGIEEVDYAVAFGAEPVAKFPPDVLAGLTVDQFEAALFAGQLVRDDEYTPAEAMDNFLEGRRMFAERRRREEAEVAARAEADPDPTPPEAN